MYKKGKKIRVGHSFYQVRWKTKEQKFMVDHLVVIKAKQDDRKDHIVETSGLGGYPNKLTFLNSRIQNNLNKWAKSTHPTSALFTTRKKAQAFSNYLNEGDIATVHGGPLNHRRKVLAIHAKIAGLLFERGYSTARDVVIKKELQRQRENLDILGNALY